VDFVEICNVYVGKMLIKAAKRIFNSHKICCSYSDLNFGVTFLEHSVQYATRALKEHRPLPSPDLELDEFQNLTGTSLSKDESSKMFMNNRSFFQEMCANLWKDALSHNVEQSFKNSYIRI